MSQFDSPPVNVGEFQEPPAWPKVTGIVSIVWASLGLCCTACGTVSLIMMPQLMKGAEDKLGPMPDVMKPQPVQILLAGLGLIPIIILLAAGIMTLRRSRAGIMLHVVYGVLALVMGFIGIAIQVQHQLALQAWAQQNSNDKWAQQANSPFAWIGVAFGVVLSIAYPLFCLVWFGVIKRKADMGSNEPVSI